MDLQEMLDIADTGDIILFNNPMASTYLIKWATDSKWDHVGMILKYSDNPAETILLESAGCGVFICYARDRLTSVLDDSNPSIIGWRRLVPRKALDNKWKKKMHREAEKLVDLPYETNFSDFVKAWVGEDETTKWVLSNMGGTLAEGATKGEDLNSVFCSELAAHMLKEGGLMDRNKERDANAYAPRDFSSQGNAHLDLKSPFKLEQEVRVRFNLDRDRAFEKKYVSTAGASPLGGDSKHGTVGGLISNSEASQKMYARMAVEMAIEQTKKKLSEASDEATKADLKKQLKDLETHLASPEMAARFK
jgi:hypothetical protein